MKDVFKVRRSADGDDVLKQLHGAYKNIINVDVNMTLEDVQSGSICAFNVASGATVTLYINRNDVGFPAIDPPFITGEDISTTVQCCYTLVGSVACIDPTGVYIATIADCAPCE